MIRFNFIIDFFMTKNRPKDAFSLKRLIKFNWKLKEYLCFSIIFFLNIEILFSLILFLTELTCFIISIFSFYKRKKENKDINKTKNLFLKNFLFERQLIQKKNTFLFFNLEKYFYHLGSSISTIFLLIYRSFNLIFALLKSILLLLIVFIVSPFSCFQKHYLQVTPKGVEYAKFFRTFVSNIFPDMSPVVQSTNTGQIVTSVGYAAFNNWFSNFLSYIKNNGKVREKAEKFLDNETYEKQSEIIKEQFFPILTNFFLKKNNAFFFDLKQFKNKFSYLTEICKILFNYFLNYESMSLENLINHFNKCNKKFNEIDDLVVVDYKEKFSFGKDFLALICRLFFLLIFFRILYYLFPKIISNLLPIKSIYNLLLNLSNVIFFKNIVFFFKMYVPSLRKQFFSEKQKIIFLPNFEPNKIVDYSLNNIISFLFNVKNKLPVIVNKSVLFSDIDKFLNLKVKNNFFQFKNLVNKSTTFSAITKNFFLSEYNSDNIFSIKKNKFSKKTKNFYHKNKNKLFSIFSIFLRENDALISPNSIVVEKINNFLHNKFSYYFYIGFLHHIFSFIYKKPFITSGMLFSSIIKMLSQKVILFSDKYKSLLSYGNSSGIDLHSKDSFTLLPGEQKNVPLSSFVHIPNKFTLNLVPRSSVSKRGILLVNSPGICDPLYQGNLRIDLFNISKEKITVEKGDRIVQAILVKNYNEHSEEKIIALVDEKQKEDKHSLIVSYFLSDTKHKDFLELDIKYKDEIFNIVNEIFINNRKSKGFGSTGK